MIQQSGAQAFLVLIRPSTSAYRLTPVGPRILSLGIQKPSPSMAPPSPFSPMQQAELDRRFNSFDTELNARFDEMLKLMEQMLQKTALLLPPLAQPSAPLSAIPSAPLPAQPAPPQPIPTPVPARSYPPAPSVEALDEVELKQVYKLPLRNIRKQPMRQMLRAAVAMLKRPRDAENFDVDFFDSENCIAWPPKFGGTNMRLSRDQHLDAWYTTMLNTHAKELATQATNPFPA